MIKLWYNNAVLTQPDNISPSQKRRASERPPNSGRPGRLDPKETARITRRITSLAVCVGLFLAVGKIFVWQETHSIGILSSLIHSALDLFGALSTFFAVRYAARPPDRTYRYGRGKAESFSAVFQVCLIVFSGFHLLEEAIARFSDPHPLEQAGFAVAAMLVFVVVTSWLLIAQSWAIRATGSVAIKGDRAHYTADLLANIVVILGLLLTTFTPFERADALVGILIALWLFWTAFKITRLAWAQLMDRELSDAEREHIRAIALQDKRVLAVHDLRTRASGPHIHIQMRLDLDEHLSLTDAHDIVLKTERRMMDTYGGADILIHPHPIGCDHTHGNERFRDDITPKI